jgi:hypothetical protein
MASPEARRGTHMTAGVSSRVALAIGAVFGAMAACVAFQPGFVLGTSSYWDNPRGDLRMQLTGYLHYIHEPWGWPLGVSRTIDPPAGFNVGFADTTPILALVAKLIEPIVPRSLEAPFLHPYGLWLLGAFVLQGMMAARFAWWLGLRSPIGIAATAAFACSLPTFVMRFVQASLDTHFLLIWALLLVVVGRTEPPTWRRGLEWVALMAIAALVHAYILAMCSALLVAWCVTGVVVHRGTARYVTIGAGAAAVTAPVAALAAFGVLSSLLKWVPRFGDASFNPAMLVSTPLAAVNPFHRWFDATGFQFEGYDYLGLGLLALVAVVLITRGRGVVAAVRRHAVLALVLLALVVFALSTRIIVGPWLLTTYTLPGFVLTIATQFRASGRFVWPATYALLFFTVVEAARIRKVGSLLLLGATVLQIIDVSPHFTWVRNFTSGPDEVILDPAAWSGLLDRHRAVWSYPSFDCAWMMSSFLSDPSNKTLYQLAYQSALRSMIVNSIHNARPGRDCTDEIRERESIAPQDGTLYVLMRRIATGHALAGLERQGARCLPFERGYVCSTRLDADDARAFAESARAGRYEPDTRIVFGGDGDGSAAFQGPGWGLRTDEGEIVGWPADGARSTIHFVLEPPRATSHVIVLDMDTEAGDLGPAQVIAEVNGSAAGTVVLEPGVRRYVKICAPAGLPGDGRWLALDLLDPAPDPAESRRRARLRLRTAHLVEAPCAAG